MSKSDSNDQNSSLTEAEKQAVQQAVNKSMPDITAKIIEQFNSAIKRGISDGLAKGTAEGMASITKKQLDINIDADDPNFHPLDDYDAEEKSDEADEDRLARKEEQEEADEEPDDASPDYNRWSREQRTEDEANANGVPYDSPDAWEGADLNPNWETGRERTEHNDNDDNDNSAKDDDKE